jgi:hypothetical protein
MFLIKKKIKGINEVLQHSIQNKKSPGFKIPSHFINGLLTVIFEDQQESKCRPWWQLQL